MKSRSVLFLLSVILAMILLSACGGAAMEAPATEAPAAVEAPAIGIDEFGAAEQSAKSVIDGEVLPESSDALLLPAPTMAAFEIGNPSGTGENTVVQNTNRKIIKNADVRLLVKDTEVAVNRSTQIISDLGGYLVSS